MGRKVIKNIKVFSVILDKTDYERVAKIAAESQTSISQLLRQIIRNYLDA